MLIAPRLIIVGGSDFGREVWWLALGIAAAGYCDPAWVAGFLDDNPDRAAKLMEETGVPVPVLGTIRDHQPIADHAYVCAIATPRARLMVCESLASRGARFETLVHPTAEVGPGSVIGEGSILCRNATVSVNARLGRHVIMNLNASVGHDAVLGDGCSLMSHADVTGRVELGRGVYLGSHASVLPGVEVGEFAKIGAGSVAMRRVRPGHTVVGVPAKSL